MSFVNNGSRSILIESENDRAVLTCNATGHPEPKFTWVPLPPRHRTRIENFVGLFDSVSGLKFYGSNLIVYPLLREDEGDYICTTSNISRAFSLSVNCKF